MCNPLKIIMLKSCICTVCHYTVRLSLKNLQMRITYQDIQINKVTNLLVFIGNKVLIFLTFLCILMCFFHVYWIFFFYFLCISMCFFHVYWSFLLCLMHLIVFLSCVLDFFLLFYASQCVFNVYWIDFCNDTFEFK